MRAGVTINRPPRDGQMAFVRSPDKHSIELLQKGDAPGAPGTVDIHGQHRPMVITPAGGRAGPAAAPCPASRQPCAGSLAHAPQTSLYVAALPAALDSLSGEAEPAPIV